MTITIHHGDSREVLKTLADASIDSVVCDPPYALVSIGKRFGKDGAAPAKSGKTGAYARASAGFMGQKWDTGETAFDPEFWAEVLRVLKPGGHLIAFSGTRTYHRLACAVEDAGFEVRDMVAWLYGCLTDDAEILTATGWKRGLDVREGELVAAWEPTTGAITLEPVEEKIVAPWSGPLVRFVNDDTDQLLTPNHRVYHRAQQRRMTAGGRSAWFPDEWACAQAGEVNRWRPVKLPCAGLHDGHGIGGEDYAALLGWVWTEGGFDISPSTGVRIYQSESANPGKAQEVQALVDRIAPGHKRYDRERTYTYKDSSRQVTETTWFFTGEMAQRVRADLPQKHPTWDLLWRMSLAEKRSFWDAAMKGDGSGDDFYQKDDADLLWAQTLLALIGQRGKIAMRKAPRDGGSLCITPRDTTELQHRHLTNAAQNYDGDVWCVRVRTGAFVARRNGKVFITGNSGFPKSHDVSKGIDRAAGADRQVVGEKRAGMARKARAGGDMVGSASFEELRRASITIPATEAARQWEGWGTALKPALEPIVLARKPLDGTVAANVLAHGTGALNIAACRVSGSGPDRAPSISPGDARNSPADSTACTCFERGASLEPRSGRKHSQEGSGAEHVRNSDLPTSESAGAPADRPPLGSLGDCPTSLRSDGELARGVEAGGRATARRSPDADTARGLRDERGHSRADQSKTCPYCTAQDVQRQQQGRWPANVVHDGSDEVVEAFPERDGMAVGPLRRGVTTGRSINYQGAGEHDAGVIGFGDTGSAARFFYSSKADAEDRLGSKHPTVKPIDLMAYLCRLVTPPGGTVLDPFAGTGTTGLGAMREGFDAVLIEREAEYVADIKRRIAWAQGEGRLTAQEMARRPDAGHEDLPLFGT